MLSNNFYPTLFYFAIFIMGIGLTLLLRSKDSLTSNLRQKEEAVCVIFAVLVSFFTITFLPVVDDQSDRANYAFSFQYRSNFGGHDYVWYTLAEIVRLFTDNYYIYFAIVCILYIGARFWASKLLCRNNYIILLFAFICSFMFYSYGTNTMRSGLASSLTLLSISIYKRNKFWGIPFFLLAIFTHTSMGIPIAAFIIANKYPLVKVSLGIWCLSVVMSIIAGNSIAPYIGELITDNVSEQAGGYILNNNDGSYKSGFRWDFLLYSVIPIFVGVRYQKKLNYQDRFYKVILCTYILTNTFFVLVIRANFIDRFGYLSWMLMPIVLLYPLLNSNNVKSQSMLVARTILLLTLFTFLMYLRDFIK